MEVLLFLLFFISSATPFTPVSLTFVNNCPFTVCPAIKAKGNSSVIGNGGFCLQTLELSSFPIPNLPWSSSLWGRTSCYSSTGGRLSCLTGDCSGRLSCSSAVGSTPVTTADISVHRDPRDGVIYSVSLVNGFNLPMTVTPHSGKGYCPVVGCRRDINAECMQNLAVYHQGKVIGCQSACGKFGTDFYCCRGEYEGAGRCKPSKYSEGFKRLCPDTYTYAGDNPFLINSCTSPAELKVIFCHY